MSDRELARLISVGFVTFMLVTFMLVVVFFIMIGDHEVGIIPVQPCVTNVTAPGLRSDMELCTMWEDQGKLVVGPMWLRP